MVKTPALITLAYGTFPDAATAARVCEPLVAEGTLACANIGAPHTAIYRWQGRVETQSEVGVWMKLRSAKRAALTERIRTLHPFAVPALVFLDVTGGLPEFLSWVNAETL